METVLRFRTNSPHWSRYVVKGCDYLCHSVKSSCLSGPSREAGKLTVDLELQNQIITCLIVRETTIVLAIEYVRRQVAIVLQANSIILDPGLIVAGFIPRKCTCPIGYDMSGSRIIISTQNCETRRWYTIDILCSKFPLWLVIVLWECASPEIYERKYPAEEAVQTIYNVRSCQTRQLRIIDRCVG